MKEGRPSSRRDRRVFSEDFKRDAVRLVQERGDGVAFAKVARDLDVRPAQLREWIKAQRSRDQVEPRGKETLQQEVRRLRREVSELRQERDFAKKAAVYFAKESR